MTAVQFGFELTAEGELKDQYGNLLDLEGNIVSQNQYDDSTESEQGEVK